MKIKIIICLVTLLIAAVHLGLLWKGNASLRAQIAAQPLTVLSSAVRETAKSSSRGSFRVPQTERLTANKSVNGAINWLSVLKDPDPVRRAGRFYTFVSHMTPESAIDAAVNQRGD